MCHMSVDNATRERIRAPFLVRVCGAGRPQAFGRGAARACATSIAHLLPEPASCEGAKHFALAKSRLLTIFDFQEVKQIDCVVCSAPRNSF